MNIKINTSIFNQFPNLESKNLTYREFKEQDFNNIFKIRSNKDVMKYMDTEPHKTVKDSKKLITKIKKSFENKKGINWVIEEKLSNKFIGYFGFWRIVTEHCRAEIGYALNPDFWGKGHMTETLNKFIEFGFNQLKLHSIEANVNPKNKSSIRLLKKTGFKQEAYFRENYLFNGKFIDSVIYSLVENDIID